jgi:hypothetical protein
MMFTVWLDLRVLMSSPWRLLQLSLSSTWIPAVAQPPPVPPSQHPQKKQNTKLDQTLGPWTGWQTTMAEHQAGPDSPSLDRLAMVEVVPFPSAFPLPSASPKFCFVKMPGCTAASTNRSLEISVGSFNNFGPLQSTNLAIFGSLKHLWLSVAKNLNLNHFYGTLNFEPQCNHYNFDHWPST